jgi:eukaryotic-like serine/threonine-protein kinase
LRAVSVNSNAPSGPPPVPDLFAGTPYRVQRRLGRGGMADVFVVLHEELGRELVIKLLHRQLLTEPQQLDRVRVEAHSLAHLSSPHIVQVTDFHVTRDGTPFIVMEYLKGRTLKDELSARGALSLFDALYFADQALAGLAAVHALGIVHRDIKPSNLFLSESGATITLKLLDFGIARVIPGVSAEAPRPLSVPTSTGTVLGTPRYLSPEAALGKRVDHRADLYSLGLVLYEMVAGRGPFEHLKHDFLAAHSVAEPAPPSYVAKSPVPRELDAVILRALHKSPDARYQSADEFRREVVRIWELLSHSHGLETTLFSREETESLRTTGQVRRQASPTPDARDVRDASSDAPDTLEEPRVDVTATPTARDDSSAELSGAQPLRTRVALLTAAVLVSVATTIAVTVLLVALFTGSAH